MKKYTLSLLLLAICCCWGFSQAEFCGRAVTLECGQSVSGNNATGTDLLRYADYGTCMQGVNASSNPFTGREIVYIVNVEGTFTISLSGLTNDLDLFVFPDFAFSECRGLSCTRSSTNSNRTNESITISNASGTYFIVVDAYSASIASPFRLSLDCSGGGGGNENPCEEAEPITCDETIRSNNFSGSSQFDRSDYSACHTTSSPFNGRDRVYRLAVPSNRNEVRVQLSGLSADLDLFIFEGNCAPGSCVKKSTRPNNSSEILVLQNTASKTYYLVVDAPNDSQSSNFSLNVTCEDPCEDIETDIEDCESVSFQYAGSNGSLRYQFSVPSALASGRWTAKKGNSTITIGNGRSINFTFNSGGEYEVCYIYTNADGCEIKCCKTIFIENPYDCDRIFYRFNNTTNRYELSIPGIAAANVLSWTDDDNNTTIGTGTTVTVPIGAACTVRRFSVRFLDPATNCYRICCIAIYICDPYDCNKINATENTSNYTLNLPGVAAANVLRWQNDDTGVTVTGSASQSSITVPKPAPGQCARYSAFFYDPGVNAYRVCCIRFCQPDECEPNKDPNCDDITFRYIGSNGSLRYQFSVPNGLPSSTWTAQRTGGGAFGIGSGRTVNFTFSASGEYEICYKYTNSEGCEVLCCITIFIEDPYDCDRITYSYDRNTQLYTLTIPGIPAGNIIQWQDDQTGQVVGTGTSITVPINSTCELRLFSVIFLDPATNCYRICCLRIFICDPYDCDDITVTENATDYTLSIPGIPAANILRWQDDQTLATIATNTNSVTVPKPAAGQCAYYSVFFLDPATNCYRVCCVKICGCEDGAASGEFVKIYGDSEINAFSEKRVINGFIYTIGINITANNRYSSFIKMDLQGNIIWQVARASNDYMYDFETNGNGEFVIIGYTWNFNSQNKTIIWKGRDVGNSFVTDCFRYFQNGNNFRQGIFEVAYRASTSDYLIHATTNGSPYMFALDQNCNLNSGRRYSTGYYNMFLAESSGRWTLTGRKTSSSSTNATYLTLNPDLSVNEAYEIAGGSGWIRGIPFKQNKILFGINQSNRAIILEVAPNGVLKWAMEVPESRYIISAVKGNEATLTSGGTTYTVTDIFFIGLPKSGNTLRQVVYKLQLDSRNSQPTLVWSKYLDASQLYNSWSGLGVDDSRGSNDIRLLYSDIRKDATTNYGDFDVLFASLDSDLNSCITKEENHTLVPISLTLQRINITVSNVSPFTSTEGVEPISITYQSDYICEPDPCDNLDPCEPDLDLVDFNYTGQNGTLRYTFTVPNGTPNGTWSVSGGQYGNNGFNIGTGLSTSFTFPSVGTYTICYTYTDADGCDKECCKTICISGDPYDCDLIQQVYDASSNTWTLSVPNAAGSRVDFWQNDITFQRFGQGQLSVSVPNPPAGECAYYSVKIFDPACGGYKLCCLEICNTGCGSANFIDIKCTDDSTKYDLQIAVNNTSGRSNVDVEFTILSPLGVTFQGCQNYIKVNNIGTSTNPNLQLEGCLVPLIAGMTIRIKVSLVDGDPTSNWCCHLEDIVVTIPECETCIGEPDPDLNCIDVYEPVCGCDGLTYSNECYAQREGVLQWTTGECPCQGEPKDIDCAAVYEPVCGCDGMTYSNDCFAAAAGISSWTAGECPCTGANLVINGDFEQGNSAFSSSLPSNCSCDVGSYCIAAKARDKCNNPATWTNVTSSGNYMVIDARDNVPYDLWSQGNINVTGGQTYDFTFDLYPNISFNGSPTLELWINGSAVLTNIQGTPNQWNTIMSSWTAPSSGSISLAIRITQTGPTGDFGIDNIKFVNCGSGNNAEQHQIESRTASSATISLTNFPNPFHNSTTIAFTLPNESEASLEIFDTNGKVVFTQNGNYSAGEYRIELNTAQQLSAGIYYYRLSTDTQTLTKSMMVLD